MSLTPNQLARLRQDVEEVLEEHGRGRPLDAFAEYRDDPAGFFRDVLGCTDPGPVAAQLEIAGAVCTDRLVVVQSCNGFGKDWLAARLALWWVYARRGLALVLGPTERQVREVVMRNEVRVAFNAAPDLPGKLYELALRVEGAGGILAMTSTDSSKLTGFHHPNGVLVVITEAQGVEGHTWEASLANTTGDGCAILAVGNPLSPVGKYFEVCRSNRWRTFTLSAFDHPNVIEGREVIPGAVTRAFVDAVREDGGGESSPIYLARVLGQFPSDAEEVLCKRSWLEAAAERWEELRKESLDLPCRVACDPARYGGDESVLAVAQGPVLVGFRAWRHASTMETTGKILDAITTLEEAPDGERALFVGELVVDEVGLGAGVVDRTREQGRRVTGFNGARSPSKDRKDRFANARAEVFWHLRTLLEKGEIALPREEKLFEELTAIRWHTNSSGKIQIEGKDLTRTVLGRSPDRADAASMAFMSWQRPRQPMFDVYFAGMVEPGAEPEVQTLTMATR